MKIAAIIDKITVGLFIICMIAYLYICVPYVDRFFASETPIEDTVLYSTTAGHLNIICPVLILVHVVFMFIFRQPFRGIKVWETAESVVLPLRGLMKYFIRSSQAPRMLYASLSMCSILASVLVVYHVMSPLWDVVIMVGDLPAVAWHEVVSENENIFSTMKIWYLANLISLFIPVRLRQKAAG